MRGTGLEFDRGNAAGEASQEEAAEQVEGNLHEGRGGVVFHAEEAETEGEEQWIAGQTNEGGVQLPSRQRICIAAMEEEILCQVAIDQRVAFNVKEVVEHPQSKRKTGSKGQNEGERGIETGRGARMPGLTGGGGFHTIRTV